MYVRQCYPEMWGFILKKKMMGTSRFGILGKPNLALFCTSSSLGVPYAWVSYKLCPSIFLLLFHR